MKLLVLIHRLPFPPDRGAKLRAAAELGYLADRHEVWCAGFMDARGGEGRSAAEASLAGWRRRCRAVAAYDLCRPLAAGRALLSVLGGATATEGFFSGRALERQVLTWGRTIGFDAVLAFSSSMAPLALKVPAGRHVLDFVDLDSQKWIEAARSAGLPRRWVYALEGRRLAERERDWIGKFDAAVLVNQREAALLAAAPSEAHAPSRRRVHVIETGVGADLDLIARERAAAGAGPGLPDEPNVGFLGAMDYPPNVEGARWFARSILPLVRMERPDAVFWIIGRSPTRAVRELDDGFAVRVTGTVPAVEPCLARMRVSVAPLRLARGVQTKVLTAMAAGVPCVVTTCVAEGIGARPGVELVVADTPERFARAVRVLLEDRRRAEALGEAGRRFVSRRFGPHAGMDRLEALLRGNDPDPAPARGPAGAALCRVG
ncbi:MAG: TIGR03087 family PEP-CTERM/XrtA system glycosyltransferase [Phycisphaerae bacterium]|jgi:sugar transferase (PEP-CTERM/EpsH1 system associated)